MKSIRHLKQCLIYLFAYFMLQESESIVGLDAAIVKLTVAAYGTYYGVVGILQNE